MAAYTARVYEHCIYMRYEEWPRSCNLALVLTNGYTSLNHSVRRWSLDHADGYMDKAYLLRRSFEISMLEETISLFELDI